MENLIALDDNSRVWLYQSDRFFNDEEVEQIKQHIFDFARSWVSHSTDLKSYGNLFHKRIIGLFVDETQAGASGCSIDSSVHFIQALGQKYNVDFFNRMLFSYLENEELKTVEASEFRRLFKEGTINDKTLVFDNLVKTKVDFIKSWLKPLNESWMKRFV